MRQFYSGQEFLYFSPDGNFFFGGSPTGYDMITGVRSTSGAQNFGGLYYQAGVDEDFSQISSGIAYIDGYYGSFNATSAGDILVHQRLSDTLDGVTYGETFGHHPGVSGSYTDTGSSTQYVVADGGAVRIGRGNAPYLGLTVAAGAGVYTERFGISQSDRDRERRQLLSLYRRHLRWGVSRDLRK